ncbi:hypothetical protein J5751_01025 [bacterium]|nr:hypothetical protein [bacterium]
MAIDQIIRIIVAYFCIERQIELLYEMIIYDDEVEIQNTTIDDGTIYILLLKIDNDRVRSDIMFLVFENEMNCSIIGIIPWILNTEIYLRIIRFMDLVIRSERFER